CYFENKAAAACTTSTLNIFCSICTAFRRLHRIWDRPYFRFYFPEYVLKTRLPPNCATGFLDSLKPAA
ncbi:hypothetical protein, partial [Dysosmobacter sp. HCP28S3_G4]|uniref:hypothetical protein n=1 Tax=Dysosmobacter sp. HCP28S3_G4 TaxID=3438938 RepID=UPI003F8A5317